MHCRWSREKAINKGGANALELRRQAGLVGKIGDGCFVTPSGFKFVMLLNMHRSLRFIANIDEIG
jgi:hypothetical protein